MTIQEIEGAIAQLTPAELAELAEWFDDFLAEAWDDQIERDDREGRLEALIQQATQEIQAERVKPL
ncbi:MAG: hypothetical protein KIS91_10690 [Anaerolineae bacterium]|nr:hypothetical protein [Anaerolineae bacterium]